MRILNYFLCFCLAFPQSVYSQDFAIVRATAASTVNYLAFIESDPVNKSYSGWWIRQRVPSQTRQRIRTLLAHAQREFLRGSVLNARKKFTELVAMAPDQDWRASERNAFVYANLRVAQLATDQDSREKFLNQAARFGEVEIQEDLFPPPIWQDYLRIKKMRYSDGLDLDIWFPEARYLLVDGRPIEIFAGVKVEIDNQTHRFTLVYDHAPPVTRSGTWSELKAWQPKVKPFAQGTCEQPEIEKDELPPQVAVFFDESCVFNAGVTKPEPKPDLKPNFVSNAWDRPIEKPKNKITGWAWAIAGAVLVAAVAINHSGEKKSQPSTTADN